MKKIILLSSLIFSLVFNHLANAQEELFRVLASKGSNKVMNATSKEGTTLLIGKKLYKGDKISLSEGCYLGLVHKTGKTIEIKKSGVYEVDKLSGEIASQNSTLGKKYLDYVVGELTAEDQDMAKNRHKYMAVTGSVERGIENIKLVAPHSSIKSFVVTAPTTIRWNKLAGVTAYEAKVFNLFDDPITSISTADTFITIDLATLNKGNNNEVQIFKVVAKNNPSVESTSLALNYIGGEKGENIKKDIATLKKEIGVESALTHLVIAAYYEEQKMYLSAMEAYTNAIAMEPKVDDYKVLYGQFLTRSGIAKK